MSHESNPFGLNSLVDILRWRAERQPDRLAYRFLADGEVEEATFTYAELDRRARAIGALLQDLSARGDRALLLYPASLDYVAAFFGCLYGGIVAVPAYPPRPNRPMPRIRAILSDAQAEVTLTTTGVYAGIERRVEELPDLKALTWRTTDDLDAGWADRWKDSGVDRDTLAFFQYTSGSTATPKGVMVTHGNLLHNEELIKNACEHDGETPCVSWLPLYHDLGLIGNMIQSMYVGTPCTLMAPVSFLQSPVRWLRAISQYRGHTSGGPNFAYELCIYKVAPEQREGLDLSSWRVAFNGAEPVRQETLRKFAKVYAPYGFRPEALYPCYGLAETTLIVSAGTKHERHVATAFRADELGQNRVVAAGEGDPSRVLVGCGRILGDLEAVIADPETRERRPEGMVGEIWVKGGSIARGYWNRPDVTEETFNAHTTDGHGPFLRTGDLGFLWGGELYITGRQKDLVIIRGTNHYPQDLELTVERAHRALRPGSGAAFSVDVDGEERLVVVQEVQREARTADVDEIAAAVRKALADDHEVQLHALALIKPGSVPKTTSGKIQRRQSKADFLEGRLDLVGLWKEGGAADGGEMADVGPAELKNRDDVVLWLAGRLAAAANVRLSDISPSRAVADYALDSLKAIELMHEIESRTGVSLPMESFFGGITLGQIADQVAGGLGKAEAPAEVLRLEPAGPESGSFPLSDGQKALWFLWRLEPGSAAYNMPTAVRVVTPVDSNALQAAFQALVDRHPALRTTFLVEDGEPVQKVHERMSVSFVEEDASGWNDDELMRRLDEEANRPFDLEAGPLLRVRLYRRSAEEQVLLLTMHHIISDFWSVAVLARELGAYYSALVAGRPVEMARPELRFTDYVHWQREALGGSEGDAQLAYWKQALGGELPVLDLPTDRPRPPVQTYVGDAVSFRVGPEVTKRIKALGQERQATLYMTLLAAFQAMIHRYAGQSDLLVGSPSAGRGRARLSGVVGYFVNPVVLRSDAAADPSFSDFLAATRRAVLGAFEHQDYPFPTLVERLQPQRDPSRSPVFQVMFALQNAPSLPGTEGRQEQGLTAFAVGEAGAEVEVGGLRLRHLPLPQRVAQFDLTMSVGELAGGLAGTLDFNVDLFDRATAERLVRSFLTLLETAAAEPSRRLSALPIVAESEQAMLLSDWNRPAEPAADLPAGALVHELFEAQAAKTPDVVAVVAGDRHWTYRELNERADRVAAHLRGLGVQPDDLVGLCADRSLDLMAGTLGILKSGAGYLPMDPEVPAERRAFMLENAGARIVLDPSSLKELTSTAADLPSPVPGEGPGVRAAGENAAKGATATAACLIYTSGSTGEPKGVLLEHRNLVSMIASFLGSYRPGTHDVVLPLTSVASASFVGEILPAICAGAAVAMPEKGEMLDFTRLAELIGRRGVSILSTVPSMIAGLNAIKDQLPKLRLILSGGEALSAGEVDRLLDTAELVNGYGLTETTICSTIHRLSAEDFASSHPIPIGRPVTGHRLYVLDAGLQPRPVGVPGELYIAGEGLARGYQKNPAGTAERFVPDPFGGPDPLEAGSRMYRTGDIARWRSDGRLEYMGRIDQQVKIRGFRIELGEIETVLGLHPAVKDCAVVPREDTGEKRLVAYVVPEEGQSPTAGDLISFVKEKLPDYMVPAVFLNIAALPLTPNGKLDVKALPVPEQLRPELAAAYVAPRGELERVIAEVWKEALKVDKVGVHDNFFDLGGHSLLMTRVHARLKEALQAEGVTQEVSLIDLFRYPTIGSLVRFLAPEAGAMAAESAGAAEESRRRAEAKRGGRRDTEIAVIGMSAHVSGAKSVDQLWHNLVNKIESIRQFTDEELLAAGNDPELIANPNYVKAQGIIGDVELFDAGFFGYNPRNAELTDPQHRQFLECAWEAMEIAGYDTERYPGRVGVFGGQSMNTYWLKNLYYHIDLVASIDSLAAAIGNDKDSITTEVSYRMNLRGPSVLVQSSSSTSLTAVHYACLSLLNHECDMAIAGGASVHVPEISGYMFQEGGITDPDGHCRAFDADAQGFVSGHGGGVVILKRLSEALADGDNVLAVIKGSACNNDGSNKVSYMAPSVDGHADVILMAQAAAGVTPDTISYVEAHGTGTPIGDPIEVAAYTQAFRAGSAGTDKKQYCAIGSVKTNIGHLDTAAGVVGLIKAALCLHHKTLVPICHFKSPNPKIDFANSPFYVSTELKAWEPLAPGVPRRAGVSSLGMGGTNTHVILEEAPEQQPSGPSRPYQLLVLSAKTPTALETLTGNLAAHLREHPEQPIADVAFTLQTGRKVFDNRRFVVAETTEEAIQVLQEMEPDRVITGYREAGERSVAFLFPGQGSQYPNMGLDLYESEPVFRDVVDRCAEILKPHLDGVDIREVIYPPEGSDLEAAGERLRQTMYAQPALFVIEYATAQLFLSWGVRPQAMIGHSVGEYTAAALAGVFSMEDGLVLVARRGKLVQSLPSGAMLAVPLPEAEVLPLLANHRQVSVGAINRIDMTVVSGTHEAVTAFRQEMEGRGLDVRPVHTSHAFHSAMMDPILDELRTTVARVPRQAPQIPYLSNVTGTWILPEEATSPDYWAAQLRGAVRFADNLGELFKDDARVLLEVGPSNVLSTSARVHPAKQATHAILSTMRHPKEKYEDAAFVLTALGRLWLAGVEIDFDAFRAAERRRRVPLPTYPFERQRYWVDPIQPELAGRRKASKDPADWFWAPGWNRTERPVPFDLHELVGKGNGDATRWLLFTCQDGLGPHLERRLRELGADVTTVEIGHAFARVSDGAYRLDPRSEADYAALVADLKGSGKLPRKVVHLWNAGPQAGSLEETLDRGYYSLVFLARTLAMEEPEVDLLVVTSGAQEVTGEEELIPERAAALGAAKVIPRELPKIKPRSVDVPAALPSAPARLAALVDGVLGELGGGKIDPVVAFRGTHRWVQVFEPVRLEPESGTPRLRDQGVYLVTGGLGGIGLAVSEHLAGRHRAKLILTGRSGLPARDQWDGWLSSHDDGDRVSRRILKVKALEAAGAEVLVESADSSDREAMKAVRERALARFGAIHGILHAAGVPGMGLIQTKTREIAEGVFASKIRGTRVLAEVFGGLIGDRPLDFVVLFSSVTAVLSQPGQSDYAAANGYMDAFARSERLRGGLPVVSIDWDAWQEVGMAVETEVPAELKAWREESLKRGLSPAQGVEALERVLRSNLAQVAVVREDFQSQIEESYAAKSLEELAAEAVEAREVHSRPVLGSAYVAPRNELEEKIASIWQEILGIDRVGIHDNFFDLGGNSLVGLKVISRVKSELNAEVTGVSLFEGPTVSAFAKLLQRSEEGGEGEAFEDRRSRGAMRRERMRQRRG